jgi:hypothetical protein
MGGRMVVDEATEARTVKKNSEKWKKLMDIV